MIQHEAGKIPDVLSRLALLERRELSRRRRWRVTLLSALLMLTLGVPFASGALPMRNVFAQGDVISAEMVNGNFEALWADVEGLQAGVLAGQTMSRLDVESGSVFAGESSTTRWTLASGAGDREVEIEVTFARPFESPPEVLTALSRLDNAGRSDPTRVDVRARNITATEFTLVVATWNASGVNSVQVQWLAAGQRLPASSN